MNTNKPKVARVFALELTVTTSTDAVPPVRYGRHGTELKPTNIREARGAYNQAVAGGNLAQILEAADQVQYFRNLR